MSQDSAVSHKNWRGKEIGESIRSPPKPPALVTPEPPSIDIVGIVFHGREGKQER